MFCLSQNTNRLQPRGAAPDKIPGKIRSQKCMNDVTISKSCVIKVNKSVLTFRRKF